MMSIRFVPRVCSGPGPAPVTVSVPPRRRAPPLAARGRRAATRSRRALLAAERRWGAGERRTGLVTRAWRRRWRRWLRLSRGLMKIRGPLHLARVRSTQCLFQGNTRKSSLSLRPCGGRAGAGPAPVTASAPPRRAGAVRQPARAARDDARGDARGEPHPHAAPWAHRLPMVSFTARSARACCGPAAASLSLSLSLSLSPSPSPSPSLPPSVSESSRLRFIQHFQDISDNASSGKAET
jgi:hypothetical protein